MNQLLPLCPEKQRNEFGECIRCGISEKTRVIHDEDIDVDETLINIWVRSHTAEVQKRLPALMKTSVEWYESTGRQVLFLSYYENIYELAHSTNIMCVPVEVFAKLPDYKHCKIDRLVKKYPSKNGIIFWIRLAQKVSKTKPTDTAHVEDEEQEDENVEESGDDSEDEHENQQDCSSYSKAYILRPIH